MNKVLKDDISTFVCHFNWQSELSNKSVLITGGTGLIGSILVRCLVAANNKYHLNLTIVCLVRNVEKAVKVLDDVAFNVHFVENSLEKLTIDGYERDIDYIIHLAAPTSSTFFVTHPVETFHSITRGTSNLLEIARGKNLKSMVYVSSVESYGSIYDDSNSIDEEQQGFINPLSTRSCYSMGKRSAECLCYLYYSEYQLPVKIARLTQTFGAGISQDDNRVFAQFARSVINCKDIILNTEGKSSKPYCYTIDAIDAILTILLKGKNGEAYNVANTDTYMSIKEMAELVSNDFSPQTNVIIDIKEGMGYAPTTLWKLSCNKLKALGWKPHYNINDMYKRLIEYLVNEKQ